MGACFVEISALCALPATLSGIKIDLGIVRNSLPDSQDPHREFLQLEQEVQPKITSARNKNKGSHRG